MTPLFGFELKENGPVINDVDDYTDNDSEQIKGLSNLYCPEEDTSSHIRDVADVLFETEKINQEQLSQIRSILQEKPHCDILQIISELNILDEAAIISAQATLYDFEFRTIEPDQIDKSAFMRLDFEYIQNNRIMPIAINEGSMLIATSRPSE
ncbi:MAG: GspE/PulE/PilB domain-containing protein, partial [Planctomycetota bacterium]